MSGRLSGQLMQSGFLKGAQADVLFALASVADEHGQCWHSYRALAHLARRTRKTVIKAVQWLERYELTTVERGRALATASGRRTGSSNLYTLNLTFFDALILITETVRKETPGSAEERWGAAKRAADWAETMVMQFEWRAVVEVAGQRPSYIKQCVHGIEPAGTTSMEPPDDRPCDGGADHEL